MSEVWWSLLDSVWRTPWMTGHRVKTVFVLFRNRFHNHEIMESWRNDQHLWLIVRLQCVRFAYCILYMAMKCFKRWECLLSKFEKCSHSRKLFLGKAMRITRLFSSYIKWNPLLWAYKLWIILLSASFYDPLIRYLRNNTKYFLYYTFICKFLRLKRITN